MKRCLFVVMFLCCLFMLSAESGSKLRHMVTAYWQLMVAMDYGNVWETFSVKMKESISKDDFSYTMKMYLKDCPIVRFRIMSIRVTNNTAIVKMKICYRIDEDELVEETIYDSWVYHTGSWYFDGGGYRDAKIIPQEK